MSGKSNNVEAASRVYFPLPDLSRKIERDSAHRVVVDRCKTGLSFKQSLFYPYDSFFYY